MPRNTGIIHPRLAEKLDDDSKLYPNRCDLQQATVTRSATFNERSSAWASGVGLTGLHCRIGRPRINRQEEQQGSNRVMAESLLQLEFRDRLNAVQNTWRAVVDGVAYDIVTVEQDSAGLRTRLWLRLAK